MDRFTTNYYNADSVRLNHNRFQSTNTTLGLSTVSASDALSGLDPGSFKVTGTSNEPIGANDPKAPDIIIASNGTGGFTVQGGVRMLTSTSFPQDTT